MRNVGLLVGRLGTQFVQVFNLILLLVLSGGQVLNREFQCVEGVLEVEEVV